MASKEFKSILHRMTQTTPTVLWNDSCSIAELSSSIETNGTVGATCNPVIVLGVLKKEMHLWKDRIPALIREMPRATDDQVAWRLVEEMSIKAAGLLKPIFDREKGRNGRLSIQTDPRYFRNAKAIVEQAAHFSGLVSNMIVKIPVTQAGVDSEKGMTAAQFDEFGATRRTLRQSLRCGRRRTRRIRAPTYGSPTAPSWTPMQ